MYIQHIQGLCQFRLSTADHALSLGAGEVKIISIGYEKQYVMVMLCITADGHTLPPCVILSDNIIPKN
jgi:hypothetical protein